MAYCSSCGNALAPESRFCNICAHAVVGSPPPEAVAAAVAERTADSFYLPCIIGLLAGATIGFMLRPSLPLIGQLPLETVLTGGDNLQGFETLLRSAAQNSRTYVIVGAIVGGIVGYVIALARSSSARARR